MVGVFKIFVLGAMERDVCCDSQYPNINISRYSIYDSRPDSAEG